MTDHLLLSIEEDFGLLDLARLREQRNRGLQHTLNAYLAGTLGACVKMWTGRQWNYVITSKFVQGGTLTMNTQDSTVTVLHQILTALDGISAKLDVIAQGQQSNAQAQAVPTAGPNYQRQLKEYPTFDWSSIGAEVVAHDRNGATIVKWREYEYIRRRHADYDRSIWFSRNTGETDENDRRIYARLITFSDKPKVAKGLPDEITDQLPQDAPIVHAHRQAQATPAKPPNAREQFYQLLPGLIQSGTLTNELANSLIRTANLKGFGHALAEVQRILSGEEPKDHEQPARQAPPAPAGAGELDRIFNS